MSETEWERNDRLSREDVAAGRYREFASPEDAAAWLARPTFRARAYRFFRFLSTAGSDRLFR